MPACRFVWTCLYVAKGWCNQATKLITESVYWDALASQCLFVIPGTNTTLEIDIEIGELEFGSDATRFPGLDFF